MILEDFVPFDVLQSQLFILKILSACMTNHWKYYRGSQHEIDNQSKAIQVIPSNTQSNIQSNIQSNTQSNIQSINDSDSVSSSTTQNIPQPVKIDQKQQKLPRSWDDPPPLEDPLAKYILSVLSRFLHQFVTHEDNNPNLQNGASSGQPQKDHGLPNNPNVQFSAATHEIISEIYKNAGRVIFYISASNWHVVFSRIKNRIGYLTSTNDDWPETAELKLLEVSDLNSKRLSMVLQELCGSFLHLKKSAQLVMANVLRKAIWNWIEVFPAEFVHLCQSQKRLEGGPEILFDICYNLADSTRRKATFWPLQTMLLILCPDILSNAFMIERPPSMSKKAAFLEALRNSLRRPRLADVAAVCYVDICKASTYIARNESSALRSLVPEIEKDLQLKLFDPGRPFTSDQQIDQKLMTECLTALFRLNKDTLGNLIPVCLAENAPSTFKLVLVKSCYAIASEENRFPWNPQLSSVYSILAVPLRKLFHQHVSSRDRNNDPRRRRMPRERADDDPNGNPEEIRLVIHGMTLCVNDHN
ncbi:22543_t:CDS:2, partial [Racocetra persica]